MAPKEAGLSYRSFVIKWPIIGPPLSYDGLLEACKDGFEGPRFQVDWIEIQALAQFMAIPEYRGRNADEIAREKYLPDSAWHIYQCLSWCDFASREKQATVLHYAGLHLRTGVEHLWFEIFFAAKGGRVPMRDYLESVDNSTKLYKLIDRHAPDYQRFAEFDQIMQSLDTQPIRARVTWDIGRLKRIHGGCGEKLMHFQGVPAAGYLQANWTEDRTKFLSESATWMWNTMKTGGIIVFRVDGLKKPEVFSLWERFLAGTIDAEDVRNGLKIIQDIVKHRPNP